MSVSRLLELVFNFWRNAFADRVEFLLSLHRALRVNRPAYEMNTKIIFTLPNRPSHKQRQKRRALQLRYGCSVRRDSGDSKR